METLKLSVNPVGSNGLNNLREQLNQFVYNHFEQLYEGAVRLGCHIPSDHYAPDQVQINDTRLHFDNGLKYADGHKYSDDVSPTEEQLRNTVADLQELLNAAAQNIPAPFQLNIIE